MDDQTPLISIVIPVKNGEAWLGETIPAILRQTLASSIEIIVIDSGSTDKSLEILSRYPVKVLTIPPESFNHGNTRNLGAREARGQYVVMTVQDAKPVDERWLEELMDGFNDDNKIAGVCGMQIVPHDGDKNPVDWFRPLSPPVKRKYQFSDPSEFDALHPDVKKRICSWDDVNAIYRRDTLLNIPFRDVSFAEDALWAGDVLKQGYAIVYNPAAKVSHYHFETPAYTFRRCFTIYYHFYKFFQSRPVPPGNELLNILRNAKLLAFETKISWKNKWKWLLFNFHQRQAVREAIRVFDQTLSAGETFLDEKHREISATPPQASKPGFELATQH